MKLSQSAEAGFTIKTFSVTLQRSGIDEFQSVDLRGRERKERTAEEKKEREEEVHASTHEERQDNPFSSSSIARMFRVCYVLKQDAKNENEISSFDREKEHSPLTSIVSSIEFHHFGYYNINIPGIALRITIKKLQDAKFHCNKSARRR